MNADLPDLVTSASKLSMVSSTADDAAPTKAPRSARLRSMMAASLLVLGTIELTPDNFDKEVFESGKAALVKFLAPW